MDNHTVNLALQILPKSKNIDTYSIVDKAIAHIKESGVKHVVCPFETVMEGPLDLLLKIATEAQDICMEAGAEEILVYYKIQRRKGIDVTIEEKTGKYS